MSRIERIEKELLRQVSHIVQREVSSPRLGFITITKARITPDLQDATIYFSVITQDGDSDEASKALEGAAGFIRKLVGENMRMKFTPRIKFMHDDTREEEARIKEVMDRINKDRGDANGQEGDSQSNQAN